MTQNQARRIVWRRLMTTARADVDSADWMSDEQGGELEANQRRLAKACEQVARSIEIRLQR